MDKNKTPITDEYLKSLDGIRSAEPKDYFYARLKSKLEKEQRQEEWIFPLKPVWMICTLAVLFLINTVILMQKNKSQQLGNNSIESFAAAYDQNISSY